MRPGLPLDFLTTPLAHRALHDVSDGRPENSRAAINAAVSAGYGIEIDIQSSADAVAMVFHDYDLARLSLGRGRFSEYTAQELAGLHLRGADEGIPTLPEVLELVGGRVPLLIEIKDQDGEMGPQVGPLEQSVAAALEGYRGPVAVMSFNPFSTACMADLLPEVPRGLVTSGYDPEEEDLPLDVCTRLRGIPDYDRAQCSFVSHDHTDLNRPRVHALKEQGAAILCWTIKTPQQEAQARKIAHNITFEQYLALFPA